MVIDANNNSSGLIGHIISQQNCSDCSQVFAITHWEHEFREKSGMPDPKKCPRCRSQRRLLHLNQLHLVKRNCDATGKSIISHFSNEVRHPVFNSEYWHSDKFDGREYGRKIDFSRPFFEQLKELKNVVPHVALHTDYINSENSAYTNFTGALKNCYLVFNSNHDHDCLYSYGLDNSKSSLDCLRVQDSELCYEAIDCIRCYNSAFISQCENCSDSYFLRNCIGCKNCFLCCNLRNKEYYFQNKPCTPSVYKKLVQELQNRSGVQKYRKLFEVFRKSFPERYLLGVRNENVSGNYLIECKDAIKCFDSHHLWEGMYAAQAFASMKGFLDCDECGGGELIIETANSGPKAYQIRCCFACSFGVHNLAYCMDCVYDCAHLFGCISLKHNQYCILNKQYSESDYLLLVPKLINHMKHTGEWGEFFPPSLSDFPYNLTQAQVHYPLSAKEARSLGFSWEDDKDITLVSDKVELPDNLEQAEESLIKATLRCDVCSRGYRLQQLELEWHKLNGLALPASCFFCRHQLRQNSRTTRQIFMRQCDHCAENITTAYSPNHCQPVYCEDCFGSACD